MVADSRVSERRARTIVLLETRTSWFPQPRSQFATFGAVPGEKPTVKTRCKRCNEDGKVNTRDGLKPCPTCEGKGFYLVDGYTGKTEREKPEPLDDKDRKLWRQRIDGELGRLKGQLERPREIHTAADLADVPPEPWERERDRHFRAGDYRALDLGLEWLGGKHPLARQLVEWCYEFQVIRLGTSTRQVTRAAEAAVDILNTRMPETIRVPHWHMPGEATTGYKARKLAA